MQITKHAAGAILAFFIVLNIAAELLFGVSFLSLVWVLQELIK